MYTAADIAHNHECFENAVIEAGVIFAIVLVVIALGIVLFRWLQLRKTDTSLLALPSAKMSFWIIGLLILAGLAIAANGLTYWGLCVIV